MRSEKSIRDRTIVLNGQISQWEINLRKMYATEPNNLRGLFLIEDKVRELKLELSILKWVLGEE